MQVLINQETSKLFLMLVTIHLFQISSDGTVTNTTISTIQATYRHFNLISIELPMTTNNAENEAARGCNISLSYDGISFSNHQTFLMYDKQQYNCDLENLTCIRKAVSGMNLISLN